jgi:TPR repeat protein
MAVRVILSGGMIGSSNGFGRLLVALVVAVLLLSGCERDPEADLAAGIEAYQERDFEAAYDYWAPHAEAGHLESQARLALLYSSGLGVEEDAARAVALFTPAADAGLTLGVYLRALHMMEGRGLPEDALAAFELLQPLIACEMPAALSLSAFALNGNSKLRKNVEQASVLYRRAAELGLASAQYNLGRLVLGRSEGKLAPVADGLAWLMLAAQQGDRESVRLLRTLEAGMPDPSYIDEANLLARQRDEAISYSEAFTCFT